MRGTIPPLPNTPSWCGARLKKNRRTILPLHYVYISQHCTDNEAVGWRGGEDPYSDWLRAGRLSFAGSIPGGGWGAGNFSLLHSVQTGLGPNQPPIKRPPWVPSPWREADHSPPSSAEVKNRWSYTSIPNMS
jgi:hypothetical protein